MSTEGKEGKKRERETWRDSLPIDMLLSAVSVLVVAQPSSEVPEGLMNSLYMFCRAHINFNIAYFGVRKIVYML